MEQQFGLPIQQSNANLSKEMVMRVGIPHKGGRLAFHAFNEGYPAMVSAQAFWCAKSKTFKVPDSTDLSELDLALDSAGYTAMRLWQERGEQAGMAGVFPWSLASYVELVATIRPAWWSASDLCVEPQIASTQGEIDYRIDVTATLLEATLQLVWKWQCELSKEIPASAVANMIYPPVPVLQGWSADDYLRSLELTLKVWERWQPWLRPPTLIGIGSVCRRSLHHPKYGLYAILSALEGRLPAGSRLHMFGVKGSCLADLATKPWIASADSMAYDFSARVRAFKTGQSNTIEHRSSEMTAWMAGAAARINAAVPQHRGACF